MNNIDKAKREVPASELGQLKDKYPQMAQNFEEVKKQAYEPQIERLGQTKGHNTQPREKYLEQGRGQWQGQDQGQGQTS